MTAAKHMSH